MNEIAKQKISEQTLRSIRLFLNDPGHGVFSELKGMCDRVSDSYRDRVVIELLQNAHDAHAPERNDGRINIWLDPADGEYGTLTVANDGNGFTFDNFDKLCRPTGTTKAVNEAIGNKGVGFLSVFQVCTHPEIYSRMPDSKQSGFDGYCFRFSDDSVLRDFLSRSDLEDKADEVVANLPKLYLACPIEGFPEPVTQLALEGFSTVVRLPLKNAVAFKAVREQISQLSEGLPPVHLFLSRISELNIQVSRDRALSVVLKRKSKELHSKDAFRLLHVTCGDVDYVVAELAISEGEIRKAIQEDVDAELLPEAWLEWVGDGNVSIAVIENGDPVDGRLYNFLPMGPDAAAPFDGYLDAPFFATIDRLRLQPGNNINTLFLVAARDLAVRAALAAKAQLNLTVAKHVAADFLFWNGEGSEDIRAQLVEKNMELIPAIGSGSRGNWSKLGSVVDWIGDEFLTPTMAAKMANFPILDVSIGEQRVGRLRQFVHLDDHLEPTADQGGSVVESVAVSFLQRDVSIKKWNRFYASLANIFSDDAVSLAGRRLLLGAQKKLLPANSDTDGAIKRKRRLSATFMPPLRGAGDPEHFLPQYLPPAIQRRVATLHPELAVCRDGHEPTRHYLLDGKLVAEHENREILRLIGRVISEPGAVKEPEKLRWEALAAMQRIVEEEHISSGVVTEIDPLVPTKAGWTRARDAYFGGWEGTSGRELQSLFEKAEGLSDEIDQQSQNLILPFEKWLVKDRNIGAWIEFLKKAGVSEHLRPIPISSATRLRSWPGYLASSLAQRVVIGEHQAEIWRDLMGEMITLPNPNTDYSATEVYRLPGQSDYEALAPFVAHEYARQVIRILEANPSLLTIKVFQTYHQYRGQHAWPSPISAFLKGVAWIPSSNASLQLIGDVWLPDPEGRQAPPELPIVELDLRTLIAQCPSSSDVLREAGLPVLGTDESAWTFLATAATIISKGVDPQVAEKWLPVLQEAWRRAPLDEPPAPDFRLTGRCGSAIVPVTVDEDDGPQIIFADHDDRQTLALISKLNPNAVIFEPPPLRRDAIADFLLDHFPGRIHRATEFKAGFRSGGMPVVFNSLDPFLEAELGSRVRDMLILALRYRASFFRGVADDVILKLGTIRLSWLEELDFTLDDLIEPIRNFDDSAVLLRSSEGMTLLVSSALRHSDRLYIAISEALGEALGSRKNIGEPLLALIATLGPKVGMASDYDFAEILGVPESEVRAVLSAARSSFGSLARLMRPFVQLYAGSETARHFSADSELETEEDLLCVLRNAESYLPVKADEFLLRSKESPTIENIGVAFDVDLADLNDVLAQLGPPYELIDMIEPHTATLEGFLTRNNSIVVESIRAGFRQQFKQGGDLSGYLSLRGTVPIRLPENFGMQSFTLSQAQMNGWLGDWFSESGIARLESLPAKKSRMESCRDYNLKLLRRMVPAIRTAVLLKPESPSKRSLDWTDEADVERVVIESALADGWVDFECLDERSALFWLGRSSLWLADWGFSLADKDLEISNADRQNILTGDQDAARRAATKRRQVVHSGGVFTVGESSFGELAEQVAKLIQSNSELLETSARAQKAGERVHLRSKGKNAKGNTGSKRSVNRKSDDERLLIGFFGEIIAFEWLKEKYGERQIIDGSCWKSKYREKVFGGEGNDGLGYDFEVQIGNVTWFFEVKATAGDEVLSTQTVEMGSSEIVHADICRNEGRQHYRIIYVTNALEPEAAQLFVLPNPRSKEGLSFYTEQETAGIRLKFPLEASD